jgi:hypothetical protein
MNRAQFNTHLKTVLTAAEYEALPEKVGVTATKMRRLLTGTDDFMMDEIQKLATVLNVSPIFLVTEFGLGAKYITLDEASEMAQMEGLTLEFSPHPA